MPTSKPRVSVTLTKHQHALMARVASQQGRSVSAVIGDLVQAVTPSMRRLSVLLAKADSAGDQVTGGLSLAVSKAESLLAGLLSPSMEHINLFRRAEDKALRLDHSPSMLATSQLRGRAAAGRPPVGKAPAVARRSSDPRPVITGVRSTRKITRRGSNRGASR